MYVKHCGHQLMLVSNHNQHIFSFTSGPVATRWLQHICVNFLVCNGKVITFSCILCLPLLISSHFVLVNICGIFEEEAYVKEAREPTDVDVDKEDATFQYLSYEGNVMALLA